MATSFTKVCIDTVRFRIARKRNWSLIEDTMPRSAREHFKHLFKVDKKQIRENWQGVPGYLQEELALVLPPPMEIPLLAGGQVSAQLLNNRANLTGLGLITAM
jgi:hypothetical protein